jgi:hypothetical protein
MVDLERELARGGHLPFGAHQAAGHFIDRADLLWRGDHVAIKQLIEDFGRYLYLPRLKEPAVPAVLALSMKLECPTRHRVRLRIGWDVGRPACAAIKGGVTCIGTMG